MPVAFSDLARLKYFNPLNLSRSTAAKIKHSHLGLVTVQNIYLFLIDGAAQPH